RTTPGAATTRRTAAPAIAAWKSSSSKSPKTGPRDNRAVEPVTEDIEVDFEQRLRSAIELLELLDNDRALLAQLPDEYRHRLHQVIAQIYNPDPVARRRKLKAAERERAAAQLERVGALLDETGIRTLRR